jgi:hypothetical protein
MAVTDLSFKAVGLTTLSMVWPAFLGVAGAQVMFVKFVRAHGPPARVWALVSVVASVGVYAAWWLVRIEGLQDLELTLGERLAFIAHPIGPTLWVFCLAHLVLLTRPKSQTAIAVLTVVSTVALSWAVAICLFLTPLPELVSRMSGPTVSLGVLFSLGLVASVLGFVTSNGLWITMMRRG